MQSRSGIKVLIAFTHLFGEFHKVNEESMKFIPRFTQICHFGLSCKLKMSNNYLLLVVVSD